jgi:DNA primase
MPGTATQSRANKDGNWRKSGGNAAAQAPRTRMAGRALPASRADHAVRLLLTHSALWDTLSNEDHALLCHLAAPHGPLLAWLEGQLHEHGPLTWSALAETLPEGAEKELALRLLAGGEQPTQSMEDGRHELRDLLNRMLIDQLKVQENEASLASDFVRYRELFDRRKKLLAQTEGIIQG